MSDHTFVIRFPHESADVANSYAIELKQELLEADPSVRIEQRRDNEQAQDFGATLILVLGTGAVTALAKGISDWIARNSGARVVIQTADGTVVADHLNSKDAQQMVSDVFSRSKQ